MSNKEEFEIGYYISNQNGTWTAYVLKSPRITGTGNTRCEALEDLIQKYRAILTAISTIQRNC